MHSHDGTWGFLKLAISIISVFVIGWWLESRFGASVAVMVIGGALGIVVFAGGAILSLAVQKNTMMGIAKFNADDAKVDQYRMQSFKALSGGEAALKKAQAALTVLDAKRVDNLANQRAKYLVDNQRQAQNAWLAQNNNDIDEEQLAGWE